MARHFDASIELFSCDTDHAWAINDPTPAARAAISSCLSGTERYLDALRGAVAGNDLKITTCAACASSMEQGIGDRVLALHPDIVIKTLMAASDTTLMPPQPLEMQLMRCCAVPLLVTRGRPWRPATKFAAAIDLDSPDLSLASSLIETADFLAHGCGGERFLVYGSAVGDLPCTLPRIAPAMKTLGLRQENLTVLMGGPLESLQSFVAQRQIDVLVVGGPEKGSWRGPEPSLTERLLSVVDCDVLIVPRSTESRSAERVGALAQKSALLN